MKRRMNMQPILSIYITTYNHEKYIRQAIESVLMQETNYEYEVLIGEDCSTDKTREILKKIEYTLPDNFKIFYRTHNMNNEKIKNGDDLKKRCKGKYIIALEGDDYWIDKYKIQKQVSFLEKNPEYCGVAHNCVIVDASSQETGEDYPECKEQVYTIQHYCSDIMPGQLTTIMYRNYFLDEYMDCEFIYANTPNPGDRKLYYSFAINNIPIYCMPEKMSAYRHITAGGSSFSANWKFDFQKEIIWFDALLEYSYKINTREAIKYGEYLYFRNLFQGYRAGHIKTKIFIESVRKLKKTKRTILLYIYFQIRKRILKKDIYAT